MGDNQRHIMQNTTPISIKHLEDAGMEEYSAVYGVALSMKAHAITESVNSYNKNSRFSNKRHKTISYNRIITFGDLIGKDGRCFVRIFDKTNSFGDFLERARGFKIGSVIAFYEPDVPSGYISKNYDLPVLSSFTSSCLVDQTPGNDIEFVVPKAGEFFFRYSGA